VKLLLDTCVWGGATETLVSAGHDAVWAGDWSSDPGDEEILARAHEEDRILVTLDKDFGELAIVRGQPHNGIVRLVDISATRQGPVCVWILDHYGSDLSQGAIVTVDAGRVRIRS
jgi:predicted nuclease of predicted toxin-antitoxin system